ncbi:MAG: glycine zipper family protein [bacterium]
MKTLFTITLGCLLFLGSVASGNAQMFVYPTQGQSQRQQDRDEFECYKWAMDRTGVNPANLGQTQVQSSEGGEVLRGAAGGAALGAVGGAIGGNAGKGAAIGAGVGAVTGLFRRSRNRSRQSERQAQQAQARNSYNRAYAACLKGRGYEVE